MRNFVPKLLLITAFVGLTSCATMTSTNLFSTYTDDNKEVYQWVERGDYAQAAAKLNSVNASNGLLPDLERGRVDLLAQQYSNSFTSFQAADQAVKTLQAKATISVTQTASSAGALALNDNFTTYEPADYELGFLHLYLGLNYIQKNDLQGALVEMRRANQVQEQALKKRKEALNAAQQEAGQKGINLDVGSILARYPKVSTKLQGVQNAYLFYLSALLYEASDNMNDAWVDIRRALAIAPENKNLAQAAIRIGGKLGVTDGVALIKKSFPGLSVPTLESNSQIFIIEEQGIVEPMQAWRLDLPIYVGRDFNVFSLSLPYYPSIPDPVYPPYVVNGQFISAQALANVGTMAQVSLSERLPVMLIRQALRLAVKEQLRQVAERETNPFGGLLVNAWNVFTEQADTRSWQTLPHKINTANLVVAPGMQRVQVGDQSYQFELPKGQTALLWISRQGNSAVIWDKKLGRL